LKLLAPLVLAKTNGKKIARVFVETVARQSTREEINRVPPRRGANDRGASWVGEPASRLALVSSTCARPAIGAQVAPLLAPNLTKRQLLLQRPEVQRCALGASATPGSRRGAGRLSAPSRSERPAGNFSGKGDVEALAQAFLYVVGGRVVLLRDVQPGRDRHGEGFENDVRAAPREQLADFGGDGCRLDRNGVDPVRHDVPDPNPSPVSRSGRFCWEFPDSCFYSMQRRAPRARPPPSSSALFLRLVAKFVLCHECSKPPENTTEFQLEPSFPALTDYKKTAV